MPAPANDGRAQLYNRRHDKQACKSPSFVVRTGTSLEEREVGR